MEVLTSHEPSTTPCAHATRTPRDQRRKPACPPAAGPEQPDPRATRRREGRGRRRVPSRPAARRPACRRTRMPSLRATARPPATAAPALAAPPTPAPRAAPALEPSEALHPNLPLSPGHGPTSNLALPLRGSPPSPPASPAYTVAIWRRAQPSRQQGSSSCRSRPRRAVRAGQAPPSRLRRRSAPAGPAPSILRGWSTSPIADPLNAPPWQSPLPPGPT